MNLGDVLKEILGAIAGFGRQFVNLLSAPRACAKVAHVFDAARFDAALLFLGVSLILTMILKAPMFGRQPDAFSYLAADAVWKFIVVLIEAAVIAGAWWVLGGNGNAGHYLVANCFYFGVLSVLGYAALLALHGLAQIGSPGWRDGVWAIGVPPAAAATMWAFFAWRAYGDFNQASLGRTLAALGLVALGSFPVLCFGAIFRDQLVVRILAGP